MSARCHDATKIRQVLRGLVRRERPPQKASLLHQEGRGTVPTEDAQGHRNKKSERPRLAALCAAYAQAAPKHSHPQIVANEIGQLLGHLHPDEVTYAHAATILAAWKTRYAAHTRSTKRKNLRWLFKAIGCQVQFPRERTPRPRAVTATMEEIATLLKAAKPHMRLLILLCWQTALRSGEACRVTVRDWNPEAQTIRVTAKGGKERTIPLTPEIAGLVAEAAMLATDHDQTVIGALAGIESKPHTLRVRWWELKKKAGVNLNLRLHDLRRTTAKNLYDTTKDIRAVQEYLGHDAMASTLHYLPPTEAAKLRELQQLLHFKSEVKQ